MGMIACYMGVEKDVIENLKCESDEDLFDEIESLEEQAVEMYDMDKLWDGLHFVLTGASADKPIENNLLSEAIVGTAMFLKDKMSDYIAYIYPQSVSEILYALDKCDINEILSDFSPQQLAEKEIYPNIWMEEDKDELRKELADEFNGIKEFYRKVSDEGKGVIVSIY